MKRERENRRHQDRKSSQAIKIEQEPAIRHPEVEEHFLVGQHD